MKSIPFLLFVLAAFAAALPVKEKKKTNDLENPDEDWAMDVEYGRYLKEIIQALEGDVEFRKKLEGANPDDIKSGKIAKDLDFVHHNVRSKLDEIKRQEMERLQILTIQEHQKTGDISVLNNPAHIDHRNPLKFESEDLRKLILKFNHDLEEVDKERKKQFKNYEMEKKFDYGQKVKSANEKERKVLEVNQETEIKKHRDHPKLHHPGSKPQLEEVWEEQDHLAKEDFNPKTFFRLHDLDGNGYWDELEVESLFKNELDKMYDPNAPEDDIKERFEEMERMREHIFSETDKNQDKLISYDEFMMQAQQNEFDRDEGWQGLDEQEIYSQQEYDRFEHERMEEIQKLVEAGAIPPVPGYHGLQPPEPSAAFHAPLDPLSGQTYQGLSHHDNPPLVETNHIAQPNLQHLNDALAVPQPNSQPQQQPPHVQQAQFQQQPSPLQQAQFQQQPPPVQQAQFQHQPPHVQQAQFQQPPVHQSQFQQQQINVQQGNPQQTQFKQQHYNVQQGQTQPPVQQQNQLPIHHEIKTHS